jgi:hypothetical protein
MAKVKLDDIIQKAFEDEKFHKELLKNADEALTISKLKITATELKKLKDFLGNPDVQKDFKAYKKLHKKYQLHTREGGTLKLSPPW